MANSGLIIITTVAAIMISSGINMAEGCFKKFNNGSELAKAVGVCMKNLSLTVETLPKLEDYLSGDYDDKCFGKCVLENMDLLTEARGLDRDALFDMIEENAPKPLVNKLTEAVTKCSESSGVMKVTSKRDCRPFAQFHGCMITSAEKLC